MLRDCAALNKGQRRNKKKRKQRFKPQSHTDSVMGLAWNREHRYIALRCDQHCGRRALNAYVLLCAGAHWRVRPLTRL